jgi:hypothetical protein
MWTTPHFSFLLLLLRIGALLFCLSVEVELVAA